MEPSTKLYNQLCELTTTEHMRTLNVHDVFTLLKRAMELAEQVQNLTGLQKKMLVMEALQRIIEVRVVDNLPLRVALVSIIEPSIDAIVEVSKQQWLVNVRKGTMACCLAL